MICSDETTMYIIWNGDKELLYLLNFIDKAQSIPGSLYVFGSVLQDEVYRALQDQAEWPKWALPSSTPTASVARCCSPGLSILVDRWFKAQPEELKVYWECNAILERMLWNEPAGDWPRARAAFYVAQMLKLAKRTKEWNALLNKCNWAQRRIDPPQGYRWIPPSFDKD